MVPELLLVSLIFEGHTCNHMNITGNDGGKTECSLSLEKSRLSWLGSVYPPAKLGYAAITNNPHSLVAYNKGFHIHWGLAGLSVPHYHSSSGSQVS